MKRITIGLTVNVTIKGKITKEIIARVDTGATKSSMCKSLVEELGLGQGFKQAKVKSAHGIKNRPVVVASISIERENFEAEFTVAERAHMKYQMLIGQNVLKRGFLIDPLK